MAILTNNRRGPVQMGSPVNRQWRSFRKGLNLLLQDIELDPEEYKVGDNLILKGAGILTQRPGTGNSHLAGSGKIRGIKSYYKSSGAKEIVTLSDIGYLTKKNNASYAILPGASFTSGLEPGMAQLQDRLYVVTPSTPLRFYDGSSLYTYTALITPSGLSATKSSMASGLFTWSWRVSAVGAVGETLAATAVTLASLPEELSPMNYATISWGAVPGATSYNIYGRLNGGETYLANVPSGVLSWKDDGSNIPSIYAFPPEADSTRGPVAKYLITSKGKLILANVDGNASRIIWSGGGPNQDKFHWSKGGGYVDVNKNDGEEIMGIADLEGVIYVWKERSIYTVELNWNDNLGIIEPTVNRLSSSLGCVSHKTIQNIENDFFFVSRKPGGGIALYSLGNEPNMLNVIRTNEISAAVRPELEKANSVRFGDCWGAYWKNIYWFFYPIGGSDMKCIGRDRERGAWIGPFDFPNSPACGDIYYDTSETEFFLYGDGDDGFVTEVSEGYKTDKGTAISWVFESRKEELDDPMRLKNLQSVFAQIRNLQGSVTVQVIIETKEGADNTIVAKSITLTTSDVLAGFGSNLYGSEQFGDIQQASNVTASPTEAIKYITLNKTGIRAYKIRITGTGSFADIVALKAILTMQSSMNIPSTWRV